MKRLSIKVRVTLWYALLLIAICAAMLIVLLWSGEHTASTYCYETLRSAAVVIMDELEYEHGTLEIDFDVNDVPNVYASLFSKDGSLIYGRSRVDLPFKDGVLQHVQRGNQSWYVYDVYMQYANRDDVWLRLYTSATVITRAYRGMLRRSFWLFPLLAALAVAGGYFLTANAFQPVKRMGRLAASIADGKDLSRRIGLAEGKDELHELSKTFDAMLERLDASFQRERRFTSDVAHELRTPINAIATQCEFGLSRESAAEKDGALEAILRKNEELNTLVRQLLLIARTESGQMEMDADCPLDVMLSSIVEDLRPVAEERDIHLELIAQPCTLRGNRALLSRAFVNLIDNAMRYGRVGGHVRVMLNATPEEAVVCVEDDGRGIAPEDLPKVFDRFWRADVSRATPGTGIGLSIVQAVAEAHSGCVHVTSEPGRGSRFEIHLPR